MVASLGFAAPLFSLGYVALEILFTNGRRLLSIETEPETARQMQSSILPAREFPSLRRSEMLGRFKNGKAMAALAGSWMVGQSSITPFCPDTRLLRH
jgi:hypothetical protein